MKILANERLHATVEQDDIKGICKEIERVFKFKLSPSDFKPRSQGSIMSASVDIRPNQIGALARLVRSTVLDVEVRRSDFGDDDLVITLNVVLRDLSGNTAQLSSTRITYYPDTQSFD